MSQLFSKSIIKSAISSLQGLSLDKEIALVNELYNDFRKGNMKDETRYEQNFNELFFHQLLGYDPKTNLHPKASTPVGSKIADVGLGFFADGQYSYEGVKVVVELKGSEALLDKKQASYGGQTPVDQGFGYKTSFKDCPWLIVSNFASIRLYRDNKQDFELWTIEDLVKPDNDYYNLKSLLVILGKKYLISESGKSPTETRLSEVRIIQEQITKKFYQQYKSLRFELINDIRRHNPEVSIEAVVEKSQKIIDRVIFIHFCEDKGLLPDNKLRVNVSKARELEFSPREILKKFFHFIDKGSKDGTIPAYNGGLFAPDEDLDTLEVGDEICYKFINLGDFDFNDELSVNILGHIFEQSISDIEQLKIDLLGQEMETDQLVEKKESKRKKDGIFYTPEYIVDYIVQNSLMTYLEEKEQECFHKYLKDELKAYQAYQQILQNVKVLDPACGSGAFLVRVFDYLYSENKRIGQIVGSLFDDDVIYKDILRNNIYGVDLNPESVEITKLSLWLKSAQKGKKLNNLDDNIKCGNSLIDDPAVAGDRAFNRHQEFKTIMDVGGFDVIVGNPPYLRIQGLKGSYPELTKYYENSYRGATGKYDIYVLFIEQAHKLINDGGVVSFILPHKFLISDFGEGIRGIFAKNKHITSIIHFQQHLVFKDAATYTCIINIDKKSKEGFNFSHSNPLDITEGQIKRHTVQYSSLGKDKRLLGDFDKIKVFKKLSKISTTILDLTKGVYQGIVSTGDDIFMLRGEIKGGYFTGYSEALKKGITLESEIVKPILKGQDIKRYLSPNTDLYIIYPHYIDDNKKTICFEEDDFKLKYPLAYEYLLNFKASLIEKKIKYKTNPKYWYGLHRSRDLDIFANNFLLTPQLQNYPNFTISFPNILADAGGYIY